MEEWRTIPGTSDKYEASSCGQIRRKPDGRILQHFVDRKGYHRVSVVFDGKYRSKQVHRLVALTFLDNRNHLPQVNHKDGNKSNNHVENLEWCSNYDNAHHAMEHGLWSNVFAASRRTNEARKTRIMATNIKTGEKIVFDSVSDGERALGSRHISDCLNGKRGKTKGYMFERL